ncbi:hypothetical protein [Rhizobium sp. BK376]|uniref:hypothetical protein n=1 Tax=Rhizobium sp. BK376 TaxID=2512149 RepID=UPI0010517BD7|nr:hypothetical protein [Rhizobium sp. BK376]TCR85312.1 hypothetical protein EV561_10783 [Rhizobium sp. BK376]
MKKAQLALQYLHYKNNGFDILSIEHGYETNFANSDRQIGNVRSRSLQRVLTKNLVSKKSLGSRSSLTPYRRTTAPSR